jgi:hypothetical protein
MNKRTNKVHIYRFFFVTWHVCLIEVKCEHLLARRYIVVIDAEFDRKNHGSIPATAIERD